MFMKHLTLEKLNVDSIFMVRVYFTLLYIKEHLNLNLNLHRKNLSVFLLTETNCIKKGYQFVHIC